MKPIRFPRTGALALAAAVAGILTASAPAQGATYHSPAASTTQTVRPLAASGCSGDACILLPTPHGGLVGIQGWSYSQPFYGHFQLTGPNNLNTNSPTTTWYAGSTYQFPNTPAVVGPYCITAWSGTANVGKACESIK